MAHLKKVGFNMDTLKFILAGNATFTLLNTKTGNRFTYKVTQPKENTLHFVKVLTGNDNENDFTFIGTIFNGKDFRYSKKSSLSFSAQSVQAFIFCFNRILNNSLPSKVQVYHEGRCGKCGRKLTVPESVESGFGPECAKNL